MGQTQRPPQLSSVADQEEGAGLELCPCDGPLFRAGPLGSSTQQCLQSPSALLVGFVDLVFSKLPQVVQTCPGEPTGAQQEPQTLPAPQGADQGSKVSIPAPHSCHHLVGQGPPVIITLMLGSGPLLSPGPVRRFTWFTSRTP